MSNQGEIDKIRAIFNEYDTNKNGTIDKSEFKPFFKDVLSKLGETIDGQDFEDTVNEGIFIFDQNKNDVIDFDEFVSIVKFLQDEKGYKLK